MSAATSHVRSAAQPGASLTALPHVSVRLGAHYMYIPVPTTATRGPDGPTPRRDCLVLPAALCQPLIWSSDISFCALLRLALFIVVMSLVKIQVAARTSSPSCFMAEKKSVAPLSGFCSLAPVARYRHCVLLFQVGGSVTLGSPVQDCTCWSHVSLCLVYRMLSATCVVAVPFPCLSAVCVTHFLPSLPALAAAVVFLTL